MRMRDHVFFKTGQDENEFAETHRVKTTPRTLILVLSLVGMLT